MSGLFVVERHTGQRLTLSLPAHRLPTPDSWWLQSDWPTVITMAGQSHPLGPRCEPLALNFDARGWCVIHQGGGMIYLQVDPDLLPDQALVRQWSLLTEAKPQLLSADTLFHLPWLATTHLHDTTNNQAVMAFLHGIRPHLPALLDVCLRPRLQLVHQRERVALRRVTRVDLRALTHLTQHPEWWEGPPPRPREVEVDHPTTTLNTPENQCVAQVVHDLLHWVGVRKQVVARGVAQQEVLHAELFRDWTFTPSRQNLLHLLVPPGQDLGTAPPPEEELAQLRQVEALLTRCLHSPLMRQLPPHPPRTAPRLTNLLRFEPHYRQVMTLHTLVRRPPGGPLPRLAGMISGDLLHQAGEWQFHAVRLTLHLVHFQEKDSTWHHPAWEGKLHPPDLQDGSFELHLRSSRPGGAAAVLVALPLVQALSPRTWAEQLTRWQSLLHTKVRQILTKIPRGSRLLVVGLHPSSPWEWDDISPPIPPSTLGQLCGLHPLSDPTEQRAAHHRTVWTALLPSGPMDLASFERLERLLQFFLMGLDLAAGLPLLSCPACGELNPGPDGCHRCAARWSTRRCHTCGGDVPRLDTTRLKVRPQSPGMVSHRLRRDLAVGPHTFAAPCESQHIPPSGMLNVICPWCGTCPGRGKEPCGRCSEGGS